MRVQVKYVDGVNSHVKEPRWMDTKTGDIYDSQTSTLKVAAPHCTPIGLDVFTTTTKMSTVRTIHTLDPIMDASPTPPTDPAQAFKSDGGKPRFDLLEDGCPLALLEIVKVMTWAVEVKGYHAHSWQEVPDAIRRYKAALGRHRNAIANGEVLDPESGLAHWAHAACCVIFITELELRSKP